MKIHTVIFRAIVLTGFWLALPSDAQTTARGQLLHQGQFPAAGIQVTLYSQTFGRSSPSMSGNDGMFYIYNVPFGTYYLEVWVSTPPQSYPVQITGYPFHDLPRFSVP
jgi:hypothetical protein